MLAVLALLIWLALSVAWTSYVRLAWDFDPEEYTREVWDGAEGVERVLLVPLFAVLLPIAWMGVRLADWMEGG